MMEMFRPFQITIKIEAVAYSRGTQVIDTYADELQQELMKAAAKYASENNIALSTPKVEIKRGEQ